MTYKMGSYAGPFQPFLIIEFSRELPEYIHRRSSSLNPVQLVAPCARYASNRQTSPLLRLPAEIRVKIWNELLGDCCLHLMNSSSSVEGGWGDKRPFYKHHVCQAPTEPWLVGKTGKQLLINGAYSTRNHHSADRGRTSIKRAYVDIRILRTCRQIYCEAGELLAERSHFRLDRDRCGIRGLNNHSFWQKCSPTIKQGLERIDVFHEWTWLWNDEHISWLLEQKIDGNSLHSVRFILRSECQESDADSLGPHSTEFMTKNYSPLLTALYSQGLKDVNVRRCGEESGSRGQSCTGLLANFDKEFVNSWSGKEATLIQGLLINKMQEIASYHSNTTSSITQPYLHKPQTDVEQRLPCISA